MSQPNFKIHIQILENRAERRGFLRGIELGDVTVPPSQGAKKKRRKRRDEGNKSEWNREREGVLLMGFDGRQSYERVAAQSDSLG